MENAAKLIRQARVRFLLLPYIIKKQDNQVNNPGALTAIVVKASLPLVKHKIFGGGTTLVPPNTGLKPIRIKLSHFIKFDF